MYLNKIDNDFMKVVINMYVHDLLFIVRKELHISNGFCNPADRKLKLSKRRYAYECTKCESKFRGEKRRVRDHVYKYHLALDGKPFYC
jgi:hypothetical protein